MQRVLVWGGGAVGGTLAACWARAGIPATLVDRDKDHVVACRDQGLLITGPVETFRQTVPASTPEEIKGQWPVVVLAVKAQATRTALAQLVPHLEPAGFVLSAQNGLNELVIADVVGADQTIGCLVNFGADRHGAGHILFGNRGAVAVGETDGLIRDRTRMMYELFQIFEPEAVLTENIFGLLWGKLAHGAMLFATALTMDGMSENFADPQRAPVFAALGRAVIAVALAAGISPVGFDGFDPVAFFPGASSSAAESCLAALVEFTRRSGKTHSGVWRDLAVHKRRTEAAEQLGAVVAVAREKGVSAPILEALLDLIRDVEEGRREQGDPTFQPLVALCSSASTVA